MYLELRDALVRNSKNWTHEELVENLLKLVDGIREVR